MDYNDNVRKTDRFRNKFGMTVTCHPELVSGSVFPESITQTKGEKYEKFNPPRRGGGR